MQVMQEQGNQGRVQSAGSGAGAEPGVRWRRKSAFQTYNLTLSTARDVKKDMKQKGVCAGKGQSASTGTRHRRPGSPFGV